MNIGIYSGSFDPIHTGHLIIANFIAEFTDIEQVWFLVSPHNPLKKQDNLSDQKTRLRMVELAVGDYSKFMASDFEFSLPLPSYTVATLSELKDKHPQHNFTLIIGADNWASFGKWKDYKEILNNYNIHIYPRLGYEVVIPFEYKETVKLLNSPIIEISSTFIRNSIREGKDIQAFLPDKVYNYIISQGLYRN